MNFPGFEACRPDLDGFIHGLVQEYQSGTIRSWENLEERVHTFFTPERMEQIEADLPGWQKMASYSEGITLVHVMCVFLGLYMLPEFSSMSTEHQQIMKWVVLFHDLEKRPKAGKRDHVHAFRSAVATARILPNVGFAVTPAYDSLIDEWSEYTQCAVLRSNGLSDVIQDNRKLPGILQGIERMFGHNTPAALIIKTVLFHLSVNMNAWPPAAPLTDEEVMLYFDHDLALLLKAMNLGDSEGWNLFEQNRDYLRNDTLDSFKKVEQLLSK